jgi:hypothetical protein
MRLPDLTNAQSDDMVLIRRYWLVDPFGAMRPSVMPALLPIRAGTKHAPMQPSRCQM